MKNQQWDNWILKHAEDLKHPAGFEQHFVETILKHIPLIEPSDVIPQFHFNDNQGKNRYIDFMIINEAKGYLLPIELDGYTKFEFTKGPERFYDFLNRQNALSQQFGTLLRFSNQQMFNSAPQVRTEIQQELEKQQQRHQNQQQQLSKTSQQTQQIEQYQHLISELQSEISDLMQQYQGQPTGDGIKHLEHAIVTLQQEVQKLQLNISPPSTKSKGKLYLGGAVLLITIATISFLSSNSITSNNQAFSTTKPTIPNYFTSTKNAKSTNNSSALVSSTNTKQPISYLDASQYEGTIQTICGSVSQISSFDKGYYMNMGGLYPKQAFTAIIWKNNNTLPFSPDNWINKTVCIFGKIEIYQRTPRVQVNSLKQLK